jgi:hypothetical protein
VVDVDVDDVTDVVVEADVVVIDLDVVVVDVVDVTPGGTVTVVVVTVVWPGAGGIDVVDGIDVDTDVDIDVELGVVVLPLQPAIVARQGSANSQRRRASRPLRSIMTTRANCSCGFRMPSRARRPGSHLRAARYWTMRPERCR